MSFQMFAPRSRVRIWATRLTLTTTGTGVEFIFRFLRTVILSRLLAPSEFGVAVAITVVIFMSELVSDIGLDRFVLNRPPADASDALATAHALTILRGVVVAAGVLLAAPMLANLFGVPQFRSSFALAAAIPILRGLAHLGVKQAQRQYDYRLEAVSIIVAQLAALLATVAVAYLQPDHRAILVTFTVEAVVYALMTHRVARSRYVVNFSSRVAQQALSFGLPLIGNGLMLAVMSQTDRMLVGYYFGVKTLAVYSVVLNVAIVPLASLYRIVGSVVAAMFARDVGTPMFVASYFLASWTTLFIGCAAALGIVLALDVVTPLVFGPAYAVDESLRLLVSMIALVRVARWSPTLLLLSVGDTRRLAVANAVGAAGLFMALALVALRPNLWAVLLGLLAGDVLSTGAFSYVSSRHLAHERRSILKILAVSALVLATIVVGTLIFPDRSVRDRLGLAALFVPVVGFVAIEISRWWKQREASKPAQPSLAVA